MNKEQQQAFEFGVKLAASDHGLKDNDLNSIYAFNETIFSSPEAQRGISKAACLVFEQAGMTDTPEYKLYSRIALSDEPLAKEAQELFIRPAAMCLANLEDIEGEITKEAGILGSAIAGLFGKGVSTTAELTRLAALGSIAAGGGLGALAFGLNRDATDDDVDILQKQQQAAHYRRIAKDLQKHVDINSMKSPESKKMADAAKAVGESEYVI